MDQPDWLRNCSQFYRFHLQLNKCDNYCISCWKDSNYILAISSTRDNSIGTLFDNKKEYGKIMPVIYNSWRRKCDVYVSVWWQLEQEKWTSLI